MQKAKKQALSLRAIAQKLENDPHDRHKYARAESPPTKRFSAKERAKADALAPFVHRSKLAGGDIFAFSLQGT